MNNKENIASTVKNIIVDKLYIDASEVKDDSTLSSLGADSLDAIEIVIEVEQEFNIVIPDDQAETLTSVNAIVEYLNNNTTNVVLP